MTARAVLPANGVESHPWYALVQGEDLRQGDILEACRTIVPPASWGAGEDKPTSTLTLDVVDYDLIVLSQSCDLAHGKLEWLLACPVWSLDEFAKSNPRFTVVRELENLRRGNIPGFHLLNVCDIKGHERRLRIIDFRNFVPLRFADALRMAARVAARLRLLSPFANGCRRTSHACTCESDCRATSPSSRSPDRRRGGATDRSAAGPAPCRRAPAPGSRRTARPGTARPRT